MENLFTTMRKGGMTFRSKRGVDPQEMLARMQADEETMEGYTLAGRKSNGCLVGVSLLSGLSSGISFLGSPGYAYQDGTAFLVGYAAALALCAPVMAHVLIPFYRGLNLTTAYQYLEMRFSRGIRTVAATIFALKTLIYLGMVLCVLPKTSLFFLRQLFRQASRGI
jgi:Na+/proline symporter